LKTLDRVVAAATYISAGLAAVVVAVLVAIPFGVFDPPAAPIAAPAAPSPQAPPDAPLSELADRYDDCLAKAVAKQPLGRPVKPLLKDLWDACLWDFRPFDRALMAAGKSEQEALDEVYRLHIEPAAARAKPI
jgi:hypothetical protein